MVFQVLYNHVQDKSKVLTQKRVVTIDTMESAVQVVTKDGSTYEGDIVVGGDGIHSTVRQEMWRIANERQPGLIPATEETGE